jgi:F-type H+-transporting ATPase subunit c
MLYLFGLVIATGFAVSFSAIAGGLAQARAITAALEGMARQPEAAGPIRTSMIIGLAFIESLTIYALVIAFLLFTKLPETKAILKILGLGG